MKRLIVIGGPMGVGKTATCRELQRRLPDNVFLDGDWCWDMRPFIVNAETRAMVLDNICHLLNNFLRCGAYENVIFCWVLHEQAILDAILNRLDLEGVELRCFSPVADAEALRRRIELEIDRGLREATSVGRSLAYLEKYDRVASEKLDVSKIGPVEAAAEIARRCHWGTLPLGDAATRGRCPPNPLLRGMIPLRTLNKGAHCAPELNLNLSTNMGFLLAGASEHLPRSFI